MSEVTRREFVGATAAVAGATVVATGSAMAGVESPEVERFQPHLGSKFRVIVSRDDRVDAVLTEVKVLGKAPRPQFRAPASLILVTQDRVLDQGTYAIDHARLGRLNLLLVPTGKGPKGFEHQVIFG